MTENKTSTKKISPEEYEELFKSNKLRERALEQALDTRKFEIELYWKRASYFWTFIAVSLSGYFAIQTLGNVVIRTDLAVMLSCLGFVFSLAWFLVNKGGKYWQENWEKHVDNLGEDFIGPLYKVILERNKPASLKEGVRDFITGPGNYSVSKINLLSKRLVTTAL
uniref:Uncharacterized protein n=1 Tax=OCS116 cluster bacterium TaxID=2030921 RepID=A0A2A4Z958_9PROT